jgi:hypothetical protein
MATIVTHKIKGGEYILLGAGYGAYKATRPSLFFGNLAPSEDGGELPMVLLCGPSGEVGWVPSEDIEVVRVDGDTPAELLGQDA